MQGALRVLRRPGGVQHKGALVRGGVLGGEVFGGAIHELLVRIPALPLFSEKHEVLQVRDLVAYLLDLRRALGAGDEGHGSGVFRPELQVARAEQRGGGDGDRPELQEPEKDRVPLGYLA